MTQTNELAGEVAIVTGAAGGIGRAACLALAAEGARVAALDLSQPGAELTAAQVRDSGGEALALALDVSDEAQVAAAVRRVHDHWGRIDVLVNNAGIILRKTAPEIDVDEWDRSFAVNVRSVFLLCKHVVPIMASAGSGSIVNTGSGWGMKGGARALAYCASKGAVVNMTRALAIDHGPAGIRVNSVNPGDTDTGMLREEARQLGEVQENFLAQSADRPLGRMGRPQEIADAIVWLAGPRSSFVTGAAIVVDGGGIA